MGSTEASGPFLQQQARPSLQSIEIKFGDFLRFGNVIIIVSAAEWMSLFTGNRN